MQVFYILEKHNWKILLTFPFIQKFASEWTEKTIWSFLNSDTESSYGDEKAKQDLFICSDRLEQGLNNLQRDTSSGFWQTTDGIYSV